MSADWAAGCQSSFDVFLMLLFLAVYADAAVTVSGVWFLLYLTLCLSSSSMFSIAHAYGLQASTDATSRHTTVEALADAAGQGRAC